MHVGKAYDQRSLSSHMHGWRNFEMPQQRTRVEAIVTSKTLATGWLIYPFFSFFQVFGPKDRNTILRFLAVKGGSKMIQ